MPGETLTGRLLVGRECACGRPPGDLDRLRVAFLVAGERVSIRPGMSALTVILQRPSSSAADFIKPMIAHFDAE